MNEIVEPGLDETKFVERMVELRLAFGWSQSELARRMADVGFTYFNQMTVSRTEKLDRPLRLGEARAIARIYGVSVNKMIDADESGEATSDDVTARITEMDARLAEMEAELATHVAAVGRLQLELGKLRQARHTLADGKPQASIDLLAEVKRSLVGPGAFAADDVRRHGHYVDPTP